MLLMPFYTFRIRLSQVLFKSVDVMSIGASALSFRIMYNKILHLSLIIVIWTLEVSTSFSTNVNFLLS